MTPPDDDIQDKQDTDTLDSGRRKNHGPGFSRQSIILGLILGAVAVGFGALFLYSLSDPQRFNHDYTRIIFYYTIPIISLIAGATAVFGRPALKAKIVILLASCFASLYLAETLLNVASGLKGETPSHEGFDKRSKHTVVMDLRNEGVNAYPFIAPSMFFKRMQDGTIQSIISEEGVEIQPLGGISGVHTVVSNELGDYLVYESDEYGMHNPPGAWQTNETDVVAVGDSFTHGYSVPSDKNYVALIRREYPATLNLGMGGNGPLLSLATFLEFVPDLKPKHVVWFYFAGNDNADLEVERKSPLLMRYLNEAFTQNLRTKQPIMDEKAQSFVDSRLIEKESLESEGFSNPRASLKRGVKLTKLRSALGLTYSGKTLVSPDLFRRIISKAKSTTESWGGQFHLVYLPHWDRYRGVPWRGSGQFDSVREEILTIAESCDISVVDIFEELAKHPNPSSLYAIHFNEDGYRVVAEAVIRKLRAAEEKEETGRDSANETRMGKELDE